ncbi:Ethanolamine ammonia-lyase light chain /Ethanolamine ammonia-lyase heavy chain [Pseudomonas cuatrocienegasensis]|uniref:Ethanolamine ammonia-lyase light chain /Ethanolamine ammonia-lyase heavy chain n=1 Tax=Pseudomonas cuatrocienegasensis TaxID=543360 RepID=A0ABY1BD82_9PSED|nr:MULTISPECIES: ethanolamine ammonia-lyase subunit EutB [Pseudomonas]OEC33971.1 ethanolamine ammonia-lyase [Pseudomonas sp. 21C1]SEQ58239.1 Ethanolamine ammonia-lyase light chain /Ethanolamine ammonia-lyase heavy chain [Pseudomonas cuatrocienegasensis]
MRALTPLEQIVLPSPQPPQTYSSEMLQRRFSFHGLKQLLGAADISKAGERMAGLAAADEVEREAARAILSGLSLQHLHDHPLTNAHGQIDSVMRVNYQIDRAVFAEIAALSLGELKDRLLASKGAEIRRIGTALTGVMAAALAKLCDVHELILLAKRLKSGAAARARTQVGLPGTLSSRLQPNHPTDNLAGISLLVYTGLSMGAGDALIGLNPAIDTVDNISATLHHLDKLRRETGAPTQVCVLSHIKTQLACLERGAPVEIMFQSLAGTERTLTDEFDVTVELLDHAYARMAADGPLGDSAEHVMYFETGQGSELTYGKHEGIDMATCEALCYGLARRYSPFMVNNVTGFIGPETHLDNFEMIYSCLQDHFMGKLLGLPMGMAPCFTLHSQVSAEGQQMATELLAAAGANFFMDVYLGNDRMLAYFDTSGHDDQTLREVHDLRPAPEYLQWALTRGIFSEDENAQLQRGPNWGKPEQFCHSELDYQRLLESVPAAYGFTNAGPRPANRVARTLRGNQAVARQAIYADLRPDELGFAANGLPAPRYLTTRAQNREAHLGNPELGAQLSADAQATLVAEHTDVQVVISDGLSAEAVHHNMSDLLPVLFDGLASRALNLGQSIIAPYGRVKLAEAIGEAVQTRLVIMLIGERPGGDALASRSLSAYLAYRLETASQAEAAGFSGNPQIAWEYTVISNIYRAGLPPLEAGSVIAEKALQILAHGAAGNRLEHLLKQRAA